MRDPAKKKANQAKYYRKHRARLLAAMKKRYAENRQDRIDYAHHRRSVLRAKTAGIV